MCVYQCFLLMGGSHLVAVPIVHICLQALQASVVCYRKYWWEDDVYRELTLMFPSSESLKSIVI